MVNYRKVLGSFVLALVVSAAASAQVATVVEERNGRIREIKGVRIARDGYRQVEAKGGRKFKPHEVVEIQWKAAPTAYKKGINQFKDGNFDKAAQSFTNALAKPGKYQWLPIYANYYLARSLVRLQDGPGALAAFQQVLKLDDKHRFVPDVYARMADLHMSPQGGRNAKAARTALQRLKAIAGRLDESYLIRAELGLARVEIMTKNAAGALNTLDGLATRARGKTSLQNMISMERGRAHVVLGQYAQAEKYFKAILEARSVKDPEVIAGAANGLGDCQWHQSNYSDAMWTYSRTYALFHDREDLGSQVAWALFRGGLSFRFHAGKLQGDERAKYYRYGTKVLRRAAKEFKGTQGGRLAAKELGLATGN